MKFSKKNFHPLSYFAILAAIIGVCGWQSWAWWNWVISAPQASNSSSNEETVQIQIPPGTSAQKIGLDLEAAGLIRSTTAWKFWNVWQKIQKKPGNYQAGTYQFSFSEDLPSIAEKIRLGKVVQTSFTIPEGWSIQEMSTYFDSLGYFSATEFVAAASQIPREKYPWLPNNLPHLEGFLYPDTYQLPTDGITPELIIKMMLDRFQEVAIPLDEENSSKTQFTLKEWVTLASIVEKEAVIPEERNLIAGVFINRLNQGMKLETDPTVEYGLKIKQTPDKPLTIAQVNTPSPYNTYLNSGLPPTPIASPGLASLKATLQPEKTDYLFFVARYDGTHIFSKTLAEHEKATTTIRRQRQAN